MSDLKNWITKLEKCIRFEDKTEYYILTYREISCKISKPTATYEFYMVTPANMRGNNYEWYDIINRYCIDKFSTEKNLINRLIKFIEKEEILSNTTDIIKMEQMTDDKSIENFDMAYYKMKSKLTKLINTSTSTVLGCVEDNVTSLFDKNTVAHIIIDEYLDCWTWSKSQHQMSINLINDNLFSWKIEMTNLKTRLNEIMNVEFDLHFHNKLYPNYPPTIKIVSPNLCDSLTHRLSNSKMTQLAFWTPTRSAKYIISRVKTILTKWGKLDDHTIVIEKSKRVLSLESHLIQLSAAIDSIAKNDCIDEDEKFIKFDLFSGSKKETIKETKETKKTHWNAGTGYGHKGLSTWNPDEYIKLQKEKDNKMSKNIGKIVTDLQKINNTSNDFAQVCDSISHSLLIQHLISQFKNSSLLEIQSRESLFKLYFSLLEVLATEKSIYLFDIKFGEDIKESLYDILKIFGVTTIL